jgi:hypothetical protein
LVVSPTTLAPSASTTLTGTNWAPGAVIQASVCGASAVNGSADCAVIAATTLSANQDGDIRGSLKVPVPPAPCPCVVLVTDPRSSYLKRVPITIAGVPFAAVHPARPAVAHIDVVQATLTGSTGWSQWFGLATTRTLKVTARNSGVAPSGHLTLYATLNQTPIVAQSLPALAPGKEGTYFVTVQLRPLAVGEVTIEGHIESSNGPSAGFSVPETFIPFGLIVLALILVQLILLLIRNIVRRRREKRLLAEEPQTLQEESALDRLATLTTSTGAKR